MSLPDISAVTSQRGELWAAGYRPVPVFNADAKVDCPGKQPLGKGWQRDARTDPPFCVTSPAVAHATNTGILTDTLRPLDVDIDNTELALRVRAIATGMLGDTIVRTRANSGRCLLPYRAAAGSPAKRVLNGRLGKIEVLGHGQQFVALGVHPTGAELHWAPVPPQQMAVKNLPALTEEQISDFFRAVAPLIEADPPGDRPRPNGHDQDHASAEAQADPLRIAAALAAIPNAGPADWEAWNRVGMAVWRSTSGSSAGWEAFNAWSTRNQAHDPEITRIRWEHYTTSPPTTIGAGSIFRMAAEAEQRTRREEQPQQDGEKPGSPTQATASDLITEGAVSDAFTHEHRNRLRYCHDTGAWFHWDNAIWRRERTKLAFQWAHQRAKALAANTDNAKAIVTAGKAAFAAGVERLAQSDRAFAVTSEIWDADPWLLGTPGGTVDLRTGKLRQASQKDYITKVTAVVPGERQACPAWLAFIDQATGSDKEFARFLQQWCGYGLTGITREHALLFIYGPGGNGKSVFLNTVAGIFGDYCRTAPMDTFTAAPGDRHPTDLAMLRGARLVTATETEEGRAWAEARIKQMTGGDPISARFMRQDFFTFTPQFKLTISGNHKPVLRNVDEANRRRVNIGPFLHTPTQPDRELEAKLRAEGPGILRWMLDGCLDWQKNGLVRPQVVVDATADYFEAQDLLAQWVIERCEKKATSEAASSALYRDWSAWATAKGEEPGTNKAFSAALELRYVKKKTLAGAMFLGLRLLPNNSGVW